MNDLDFLEKLRKLPDNIAGLDSPHFTGKPIAPTPESDNNSKQIANTEYVSDKVGATIKIIDDKLSALDERLEKYQNIDTDELSEDIKNELYQTIKDDILNNLSLESIDIIYANMQEREDAIINTVNSLINDIDLLPSEKQTAMITYKVDLENKKGDLESQFNIVYQLYNDLTESTRDVQYKNFSDKYKIWYNTGEDLLLYCQKVINIFNQYLVGLKADATQKAIFNLLTNNGKMQGIYYADVTNSETGKTERQLFINGEFMQLRGLRIIDNNGNITLDIGKDGTIRMNVTSLTIQGKSVSTLVGESMGDSKVIQDAVEKSMNDTSGKISNIDSTTKSIEGTIDNINESVKNAISDGIITNAEVRTIETLYNELKSRNSSVIVEINKVLGLADISSTDYSTLNRYKTSIQNAFSQVTNSFNSIETAPSVQSFEVFDSFVNEWNNCVGIARAYVQVALNNITTKLTNDKLSNDRESVFNALTNNGKIQGLYMTDDKLYINGEYIRTKDLKTENTTTTKELYVQNINSERVLNKIDAKTRVYVNKNTGEDCIEFKEGAVFKTVQGAINMMPKYLEAKRYALIQLQTDVYENIALNSIIGAKVCLEMNYHCIYGKVQAINSDHIQIFGVTEDETLSTPSTNSDAQRMPAIIPNTMNKEYYYSTVYASKTQHMYIRDVIIHGKTSKTSTGYSDKAYNYALMCAYGGTLECSNVGIRNSDNGFIAYKGGHIISRSTYGYLTRYGFYASWGGYIDICRTRAVGAPTDYTKYDAERIKVGSNVKFDSTEINDSRSSSYSTTPKSSVLCNGISFASIRYSKYNTINNYELIPNTTTIGDYPGSVFDMRYCNSFWFFEKNFEEVKGKSVSSVQIIIDYISKSEMDKYAKYYDPEGKDDYYTNYNPSVITLCYHTLEDQNGLESLFSKTNIASVSTSVSGWKYTKSSGNIGKFTIYNTTDNKALFDALKNGTAKGLGLILDGTENDKKNPNRYIVCKNIKVQFNIDEY